MKYLSSLKNKNLANKICLLRVDFNITDDDLKKQKVPLRMQAVLPTIKFLIKRRAKVVILSHRGRPKEASDKQQATRVYTLKPFVKILSKLLKKPVSFITLKELGLINKTKREIKDSARGSIFLLENLRFFPGEDKNDQKFAKNLASLGTFYVNDAFAFSHRPTASIVGIPKFLASYAGLLLEKEIKNLSQVMKKPKKPLVIILGGAKISDKIGVIKNFLKKADYLLLGGGVANTFFAAQRLPIGKSLYEEQMIPTAKLLLRSRKIILPIDSVVQAKKILDIGPQTIKKYSQVIKKAKTIVWNGPMGYIENPKFAKGSKAISQAILKTRAFSAPRPKGRGGGPRGLAIIGGGETISIFPAACFKLHASKLFISTGGGAMLEYLAGKKLPGIVVLQRNIKKL
jgi:3-phosphoglycerate kinase